MADSFTLQAGDQTVEFRSDRQLYSWWKKQHAHWCWLWQEDVPQELHNIARLGQDTDNMVENSRPMGEIIGNLRSIFAPPEGPRLFLSSSPKGERYQTAYKRAGARSAATLLYVETAPRGHVKLQGTDWILNFALGAAAAYADAEWTRADLDKERRAYRHAIDRLEQRVRDIEAEQEDFERSRQKRVRRWLRYGFRRVDEQVSTGLDEFSSERTAILTDLSTTKQQYVEQMAYRAPVIYWKDKAKTHGRWEVAWAFASVVYFALAAWAIFSLATWARSLLVEAAAAAALAPGISPAPIYIVIGGASLAVSTLIFWFGRLITKLFLSEHHLREQCGEKAVMMESFLAMGTEGVTFSSDERAIVIASVYRPSGDGLVREDGPPDLAAQAQFAKIAAGKP